MYWNKIEDADMMVSQFENVVEIEIKSLIPKRL